MTAPEGVAHFVHNKLSLGISSFELDEPRLHNSKRTIAAHDPSSVFGTLVMTPKLTELEQLRADPQLTGWVPRRDRNDAFGTVIRINLVESTPEGETFERRRNLHVSYDVKDERGGIKTKIVVCDRVTTPIFEDWDALTNYLAPEPAPCVEADSRGNATDKRKHGLLAAEAILHASIIRRYAEYLSTGEADADVVPSSNAEILDYLHRVFALGKIAREYELQAALEPDVERARRSAAGSVIGAQVSGRKRAAHKLAWKGKLAELLQPLIDREAKRLGRGVSRQHVAELAESIWPPNGILGTFTRKQKPGREDLMELLKEMERGKLIERPAAKPGRKCQKE